MDTFFFPEQILFQAGCYVVSAVRSLCWGLACFPQDLWFTDPVLRLGTELGFTGGVVLLSREKNSPLLSDQSEITVPGASHAIRGRCDPACSTGPCAKHPISTCLVFLLLVC